MKKPLIALPMYDWPEVKQATDRLLHLLQAGLQSGGYSGRCVRSTASRSHWCDSDLLLSQSCGLPLMLGLHPDVSLLGTPVYRLENCDPGKYQSVLIVRADEPAAALDDLRGRVFAYNMAESQSGYAAFYFEVANRGLRGDFFSATVQTGSHRNSIRAVAQGKADFAAIDIVSWKLACRHEKEAASLRVLEITSPMPALPLISSKRPPDDLIRMQQKVRDVLENLPDMIREALFLDGFLMTGPEDYAIILENYAIARQAMPGMQEKGE